MSDESVSKINDIFSNILINCKNMVQTVNKINKFRKKELKNIAKKTDKSKSSINIKKQISNQLAEFMNIDKNILISKTEALRYICKYVKDNDLQIEENKKKFTIDNKLSELFSIPKGDILTFMNINGLLSKHFPLSKQNNII